MSYMWLASLRLRGPGGGAEGFQSPPRVHAILRSWIALSSSSPAILMASVSVCTVEKLSPLSQSYDFDTGRLQGRR